MIIFQKNSQKIILGSAILAQLAGCYFLAVSFHYTDLQIINPPDPVPNDRHVIASAIMYFYSICNFVISGTLAVVLRRLEKRLSPYVVAAFSAPAILLIVAFALWKIAIYF
jgi:hypothetical protein